MPGIMAGEEGTATWNALSVVLDGDLRRCGLVLAPFERRHFGDAAEFAVEVGLGLEPTSNMISVTGLSVSTSSAQASAIRCSLTYCETFLPITRLIAVEIWRAGMPSLRASRS